MDINQFLKNRQIGGTWEWNNEKNILYYNKPVGSNEKTRKEKKPKHVGATKFNEKSHQFNTINQSTYYNQNNVNTNERKNKYVELEDVKSVSKNMLLASYSYSEGFESFLKINQVDRFLIHLFIYFDCFFKKEVYNNRSNPMNIADDGDIQEKIIYDLANSKRHVGYLYSLIIVGDNMIQTHHMLGGQSRVSSTYKDRNLFEMFYQFCIFCVWITFKREKFPIIESEIGRLLRSETFNSNPDEKVKTILKRKRPAISKIITQNSPALTAILPKPIDKSAELYNCKSITENYNYSQIFDADEIDIDEIKIGIIRNYKLDKFNPQTLSLLSIEKEKNQNIKSDFTQNEHDKDKSSQDKDNASCTNSAEFET
ncbi:Protein phosphatase 1 regulatory subunit 36 [Intoshia linei]|uniref:Protein phosphatase 1 regulatory subunit 36 n=1 Tax=Intoshia linei TaxID=1819745 RepID=A0A177B1L1_9BILA|nr:Protein phosphatase 1 regulatory subunit 36 [Intoshia linei]